MALPYSQMRELDALIHRHVLGWEKFRDQPELHNGRLHTELWRRHRPGDTPTEWVAWEFCNEPMPYSADIALAFQVAQTMSANGWSVEMKCRPSADSKWRQDWQVSFVDKDGESGYFEDTKLPLAICNAALKAITALSGRLAPQEGFSVL